MQYLSFTFALILVCSFFGFSQESEPVERTIVDTALIETRCECLELQYDLKKEILVTTAFDENGRVSITPALLEKRRSTVLRIKAVSEKCTQLLPSEGIEPCPEQAKLTELDDNYQLLLRVIEMNARSHGDY